MSLIPEIPNPYLGAFGGGLLYGLAVCTASCLPYIAGYIAGIGAGFRKGIAVTLIFSSGRIAAYALIGGIIGLFSGLFRLFVSGSVFSPFQIYSSLAFGVVTVIIGVMVLLKVRSPCDCKVSNSKNFVASGKRGRFGFDFQAFVLGLSRGLILCPPLIALLLYSLPFSTPIGSLGLAVLFGLGTALSPMLLLGGLTGWLLNKAPLLRKWISIGGAGILILLGIVSLINSLMHL
ncbi:MAG: sulfite exporter TauE/SafE family protein [Candidatus Bathyarchaeia archaeon]|jgi:sulfite exporter TauE/SafE